MKLCMIGTGYVGLVSGVCFADLGNDVICVDKDQTKNKFLKKGKIPIYEPGLEELVLKNYKNKRLNFSTDLKDSVKKSDIIFICVGTPTKKGGSSADLSQVLMLQKKSVNQLINSKLLLLNQQSQLQLVMKLKKLSEKKINKKIFQ